MNNGEIGVMFTNLAISLTGAPHCRKGDSGNIRCIDSRGTLRGFYPIDHFVIGKSHGKIHESPFFIGNPMVWKIFP